MYRSLQSAQLYEIALATIKNNSMLKAGDRVAVGVSGGADSVALLVLLHSISDVMGLELVVCHLNHCLRGEESLGDADFVRELAERLGLEFRLCTFDAAKEARRSGVGMEEYARGRRYAFFHQCAGEAGRIATAHTLSDAVETVVFNMVRGTGVKGLCGIPRVRGSIIRPLRDCTREQVESYLAQAGQPYRTDSSNNTDQYSRNYIRHNIIPAMERINPSLTTVMGRMMEQMEQQWQMTETLAQKAMAEVADGEYSYLRSKLLALPEPVAAALITRWLEQAGAGISARQLELIYSVAKSGSGSVQLARGVHLSADRDHLRLVREPEVQPPFFTALALPNQIGEQVSCPAGRGKTLRVALMLQKKEEITEKFYNKDLKNLVDCAKIKEHVFVHQPGNEDTIFLQDREHNLVVRYRTGSRGLTAGEISRMVVVQDENGTVWAERLGVSQLYQPDKTGERLYLFEILEDANEQL